MNVQTLVSRRPHLGVRRLIELGLLFLCLSCGYSSGMRVPDDARSIGIEIFGNGTNLRNLGAQLTGEITRAVTNLVDLPLVSPDQADYLVRGEVNKYQRRGGPRGADNRRLETGILITITSRLVNRQTDEVIRSSSAYLGTGIVIEAGIVADDTPEEVAARDRALENLATRIVLDLFLPSSDESQP